MGSEFIRRTGALSPIAPPLGRFTFKVEYHPGIAHQAADAMSRLPTKSIPAEPIEECIPVCATSNPSQGLEDFQTALEEGPPDPIVEMHWSMWTPCMSTNVWIQSPVAAVKLGCLTRPWNMIVMVYWDTGPPLAR
jgi:hypothetical protein